MSFGRGIREEKGTLEASNGSVIIQEEIANTPGPTVGEVVGAPP